jgi:hypothetical protein
MGWEQYAFPYFPPAFAIYLLWIGDLAKTHLRREVDRAAEKKVIDGQPRTDFVRNLAAGWSSKIGFFNASFATLISALSIFSSTQNYGALGITVLVLLLIMLPMHLQLWGMSLDEVEAAKYPRLGISPGRLCKILLTILNVLLILAIVVNQLIKAHSGAAAIPAAR